MITQEELAEEIVKNRSAMLRCSMAILGNEADAQDAVSEMTVRAIEHCDALRQKEAARSWLYHILFNVSKNIYIKRKKQTAIEPSVLTGMCDSINEKNSPDISEDIISRSEISDIRKNVEKLPDRYRKVIKRYYFDGASVREIADELHISEGTVKSRLYRGRRDLKKLLSEILCLCIVVVSCFFAYGLKAGETFTADITDDEIIEPEISESHKKHPEAEEKINQETEKEQNSEVEEKLKDDDAIMSAVLIVSDESEIDSDRVCYVLSTGELYIPDRELTESEQQAVDKIKTWLDDDKTDESIGLPFISKEEEADIQDVENPQSNSKVYQLSSDRKSELIAEACEKSATGALSGCTDSEVETLVADYIMENEDFVTDYDQLFSGKELETADGTKVFPDTSDMIAERVMWRKKWLDAGRYDDTIQLETNDEMVDESESSENDGDRKDASNTRRNNYAGTNAIVAAGSMERLKELVPEDIADKYAVECVFDPDAEFGVDVQDERIRNHVIDTFANLGIPESGRLYVIDFSRVEQPVDNEDADTYGDEYISEEDGSAAVSEPIEDEQAAIESAVAKDQAALEEAIANEEANLPHKSISDMSERITLPDTRKLPNIQSLTLSAESFRLRL